jgi:RND family efflux transporter MFP subunit
MDDKGSGDESRVSVSGAEAEPAAARLCYVDDSRTSAYVVRRMLQPLGYQVDHFASAEPAFVALIQEDYDLLLTDLKVSVTGMDGDDLIRTLRQSGHPKISNMPVIVITGATDPQVLLGVYDAGANQVMSKPVDADELDGHIRRLLSGNNHIKITGAMQPQSDATVAPLVSVQEVPSPSIAETPVLNSVQPVEAPKDAPINTPTDAQIKPTSEVQTELSEPKPEQLAVEETGSATATPEQVGIDTTGADCGTKFDAETDSEDKAQEFIAGKLGHDDEDVVTIEPDICFDRRQGSSRQRANANFPYDMDQYALIVHEPPRLFNWAGLTALIRSTVGSLGLRGLIMRTLLLGLIVIAFVLGWQHFFDQGLPVETAIVETGEIYQSITVPGRIVSKQWLNVSVVRSGRIGQIFVKVGDRVEAGQLLVRLDDRALLSRLTQVKTNLASAREGIVVAERTLNRLRKAHGKGAVARRFVEDAEIDLRMARAAAGIAVEEVHSATMGFDDQKTTAPFGGTITARFAEIGQWVDSSQPLFTLVDESQREIEVKVDAADSIDINIGQTVAVSSDAFPGLEWYESVVRLDAAVVNRNRSNATKVYVSLGDDAPVLRYGQQVDAHIRTAWNPNTLKIPFEALISRDGQTLVAVLKNGHVKLKPVETGIENFTMAEIKQGLNDGEMVILTKGRKLQHGDKVYPSTLSR